ncbi:MAG: alpha/beta hydrolase [Bryobacteraceae bacterium]
MHDNGPGELNDARAALLWLRQRYPNLPHAVAGFSFGARIAARLACQTAAARLIAAGFPARRGDFDFLRPCAAPKWFIQSTHDEHGPREEIEAMFETMAPPKHLEWIEADHFFLDALDAFEAAIVRLKG